MGHSRGAKFGKTIIYIVLTVLAFLWGYPFVWMLSASFKTQDEFFADKLDLIPDSFHFDNFIRAWNKGNFEVYFKNSIIVTVAVVVMVLLFTALAGYVLGRYQFAGKKIIIAALLASVTIPAVFTVIPVYELLKEMNLSQSLFGLILAESGGGHIVFIMLFSGFYGAIPKEMEEASQLDGCNFVQQFFWVMFPLSKPIIGTVVIMQSIWTWNSFLLPLVITLNNPSLRTLPVGLYALRGENVVDWTGIAAGASISVIPVILIFILLQKYFVDGMAGAVKS